MAAKTLAEAEKEMDPAESGATTTVLTPGNTVAVVAHPIPRPIPISTKAVLAVNMAAEAVALLSLHILVVIPLLIMVVQEGSLAVKAGTRMALVSPGLPLLTISSNFTP